MLLAKIWKFLYPFFLSKTGQEKMFGDVLDRKQAFLDFEKVPKLAFIQRVVHGFGQNYEISLSLLFS